MQDHQKKGEITQSLQRYKNARQAHKRRGHIHHLCIHKLGNLSRSRLKETEATLKGTDSLTACFASCFAQAFFPGQTDELRLRLRLIVYLTSPIWSITDTVDDKRLPTRETLRPEPTSRCPLIHWAKLGECRRWLQEYSSNPVQILNENNFDLGLRTMVSLYQPGTRRLLGITKQTTLCYFLLNTEKRETKGTDGQCPVFMNSWPTHSSMKSRHVSFSHRESVNR